MCVSTPDLKYALNRDEADNQDTEVRVNAVGDVLLCVCRVVYPGFGTGYGCIPGTVCRCGGGFKSRQLRPW